MRNPNWFFTSLTPLVQTNITHAIQECEFTSGSFTHKLQEYFRFYTGSDFALYTNSGTSAIAMSVLAASKSRDTNVYTSAIGWIATPQAALFATDHVYISDTHSHTPLLDYDKLPDSLPPDSIIIPVHYNGRQLPIDELRHRYPHSIIVEDCCKSLFTTSLDTNKFSGTSGDYGCFSFGMVSLIPGIFGGMILASSRDADKLLSIKYHGTSSISGIDKYEYLSFNFKTSNLHAAVAYSMLESYTERIDKLLNIYELYRSGLAGLENSFIIPVAVSSGEVPLLIDIYTKNRPQLESLFTSSGVPFSNYHSSMATAHYLSAIGECPNAHLFATSTIHPPCGPDQDLFLVEKAINLIRKLG